MSSPITQQLSTGSNYIRRYHHNLVYTLPLAPLASAPVIYLRSVATVPRPTPASYGTNLNQPPLAADSVYGNRVFARVGVETCTAAGAPTTSWSTYTTDLGWGVRIVRP